jgi:hypothetical protein
MTSGSEILHIGILFACMFYNSLQVTHITHPTAYPCLSARTIRYVAIFRARCQSALMLLMQVPFRSRAGGECRSAAHHHEGEIKDIIDT